MKYFMSRHVLELAAIQFLSYFILTMNYRAIAEISYIGTAVTDLALGWLTFWSIKRVMSATSGKEQVAYIIGGVIGSLSALFLSTFLF
jgi:hypothetical protein